MSHINVVSNKDFSLERYRLLKLFDEHLSGMSEAPSCCQRLPSSFLYSWSLCASVLWRERCDTATTAPSPVQITSAFIIIIIITQLLYTTSLFLFNTWRKTLLLIRDAQLSVLLLFIHPLSFPSFLYKPLAPVFLRPFIPPVSFHSISPSFFLLSLFPSFLRSHCKVPVRLLNTSTCTFT